MRTPRVTLRAAVDDGTFCRQVSSTILLVMMQRAENVHSKPFVVWYKLRSVTEGWTCGVFPVSEISRRTEIVTHASNIMQLDMSSAPSRLADRTRCCPPVHRGLQHWPCCCLKTTKCWPRSHRSAGRALWRFFFDDHCVKDAANKSHGSLLSATVVNYEACLVCRAAMLPKLFMATSTSVATDFTSS